MWPPILRQHSSLASAWMNSEKFFGRPRGLDGENAARFFRLKPLAPNDASALYLKSFRKLAASP